MGTDPEKLKEEQEEHKAAVEAAKSAGNRSESAKDVRKENYTRSLHFAAAQTELTMKAIYLLTLSGEGKEKGVGPSEVFKYLLETGEITSDTKETSIRRCYDTLKRSCRIQKTQKVPSKTSSIGKEMAYKPCIYQPKTQTVGKGEQKIQVTQTSLGL